MTECHGWNVSAGVCDCAPADEAAINATSNVQAMKAARRDGEAEVLRIFKSSAE
jgi:hypothetical protein